MIQPPVNSKWIHVFVIAACLVGMLACSLPQLAGPGQETQPAAGTVPEVSELAGLSEEQKLLVAEFSWPHSFTIYEVDNQSEAPVRYEIWNYYDGQCAYTFLDGVFQFDEAIEGPLPGNTLLTPYHPNQFSLGMSAADLIGQLPGMNWSDLPVGDGLQGGVQIKLTRQLMAGFSQERLVFIDALAFIPGEGE